MWFQKISESTSHSNLFIKGMPFMNTFVSCRDSHYLFIHFVQNIYSHNRYVTINIKPCYTVHKYFNHCALTGTIIWGEAGGVGFQWNKLNVLQLYVNPLKFKCGNNNFIFIFWNANLSFDKLGNWFGGRWMLWMHNNLKRAINIVFFFLPKFPFCIVRKMAYRSQWVHHPVRLHSIYFISGGAFYFGMPVIHKSSSFLNY